MLNIDNRKIISRLSFRSLKATRLRNIMAVCAIVFTTVLFTVLCTIGIGTLDAFQLASMRQSGGSGHASIKYINDDIFAKISTHPLVKEIAYTRMLSDSVDNPELIKRRGELWYLDDNALKQNFCEPTTGSRPIADNELIMDTKTIQLLNVPQEIGVPVTLVFSIKGEQVERDFILSGWWESDPTFNTSILVTSKAYMDVHADELVNTYWENYDLSGAVNAYIMFGNTFRMQEKLNRIITESGYDITDPNAPNYVESNLNWAYLSAGMSGDPVATVALLAAALLIILTGYLIIYNIFQISVLRDIRFYGLLKTIGTTRKQIGRIIRRQAVILSLIGIPIGLAMGFAVGKSLVPLVMAQTYFASTTVNVSANPLIFIGSAVFAIITVWISVRKPGKIAASVSPVEAVRYIDVDTNINRKEKRSTDGGKVHKIALSNMGRNRKRVVWVLLSLSLSFVLLNSVFTLSRGMDMDKFLSRNVDTDFLVAHADYFNYRYQRGENAVDEQVIQTLENLLGFEQGGRLHKSISDIFTVEDDGADAENTNNRMEDGHFFASVYGLDDFPLSRLNVIKGELDVDKLKTGGYILAGVTTDDFDRPMMEHVKFDVGDKVVLHIDRIKTLEPFEREYVTQEFEVMAQVIIKQNTNSDRSWNPYGFYLPSNVYLSRVYDKSVMSYAFNAADDMEEEIESFMEVYTESVEPLMNYESKAEKVKEFDGIRFLLLSVGGILSGIIGFIGVLNFVNSMLTSIISRRREFAMMQSIGMTNRQLRNMLCLEGLYYAGGTIVLSLVLGIIFSLIVIRSLMDGIWFTSYHFIIMPLIVCYPVFIIISVFTPIISLKGITKESMVDRLRVE